MKLSPVVLAVLAVLAANSAAGAGQKLRVASEGAYPPFNYIDANGQLAGFDLDIAKAICADLDAECSYVAVPWDRIIDGLEQNRYDLIVASMSYTPERGARIAFSDPYYRSHSGFVGDPLKVTETRPEALSGMRIVVAKQTIQSDYVHKFYPGSRIIDARNTLDALATLAAGKADVILTDAMQVLDWMQSPEGEKFGYIGDPVTGDFIQSAEHITARKGDVELMRQVNASLKRLRLNGTYERINANYFPFSIY